MGPMLMDVLLLLASRWDADSLARRSATDLAAESCSPMVDGADTARITQIT